MTYVALLADFLSKSKNKKLENKENILFVSFLLKYKYLEKANMIK